MRNPNDVTWLDAEYGIAIDLQASAVDERGQPTAAGARLVIVARGGGELPASAFHGAAPFLELARLLLFAAGVIDPAIVGREMARERAENRTAAALRAIPAGPAH